MYSHMFYRYRNGMQTILIPTLIRWRAFRANREEQTRARKLESNFIKYEASFHVETRVEFFVTFRHYRFTLHFSSRTLLEPFTTQVNFLYKVAHLICSVQPLPLRYIFLCVILLDSSRYEICLVRITIFILQKIDNLFFLFFFSNLKFDFHEFISMQVYAWSIITQISQISIDI